MQNGARSVAYMRLDHILGKAVVGEKDKMHCDCKPWNKDLPDDLACFYWFVSDHRYFIAFYLLF